MQRDHVVMPANTTFPVVNGTAVVKSLYLGSGHAVLVNLL